LLTGRQPARQTLTIDKQTPVEMTVIVRRKVKVKVNVDLYSALSWSHL